MKPVSLSLGANIGDAAETLRCVVSELFVEEKIFEIHVSSMYETLPVGGVEQPNFYNIAITAMSELEPLELLDYVQEFEARYGRERTTHWGPRTLDIDIIDIDGMTLTTSRLTLPHPESTKRAFVLIPLLEIAPKMNIAGRSLKEWLSDIESSGVTKLEDEM
jgi:2-amino-4-hydroxy-6-hydroxymethyldihydropteridine diphosphokinase